MRIYKTTAHSALNFNGPVLLYLTLRCMASLSRGCIFHPLSNVYNIHSDGASMYALEFFICEEEDERSLTRAFYRASRRLKRLK